MPSANSARLGSIAYIRRSNGSVAGMAFLAGANLVITCAHVVADALGIDRDSKTRPTSQVLVEFPLSTGPAVRAHVHVWRPISGYSGDIAILKIAATELPPSARPAPLIDANGISGFPFGVYGYPLGSLEGQGKWAYGVLRDRLPKGDWVQMDSEPGIGFRIQRGFSGAAVWDERRRGVVGMIVAVETDAKVPVGYLIPTDVLQQACSQIEVRRYSQLFPELTLGLSGLPNSPLNNMEQFLYEYLGAPGAPVPFGGRIAQLELLDRWLGQPSPSFALLVAGAGQGKSALLARWADKVAAANQADVAFVPISMRFDTSLLSTTLTLLGGRLRYLHEDDAAPPREAGLWLGEIDRYLRNDHRGDRPLLVVVDGADEATGWVFGHELRFPSVPGAGVKILVAARRLADCDVKGWEQRLGWQGRTDHIPLPSLTRLDVADILRSLGGSLAAVAEDDAVVRELHRLGSGDPLVISLYIHEMSEAVSPGAKLTVERLACLQPGLEGFFTRWWQLEQDRWGSQGRDVWREMQALSGLLDVFATAFGPISRDEVFALADSKLESGWQFDSAVEELSRFIIRDGQSPRYVFSHPGLTQFFWDRMSPREREDYERHFLNFGRRTLERVESGDLAPRAAPSYAIRYYGAHLDRARVAGLVGVGLEQYFALASKGWLAAWQALEGAYDGYLTDLRRAWRQADIAGETASSTNAWADVFDLQCRCALLSASLNTLTSDFPGTWIAALVSKEVWTPAQGLAYIGRISPEKPDVEDALGGISARLDAALLEQALDIVNRIKSQEKRATTLVTLAVGVPSDQRHIILPNALAATHALESGRRRAIDLARLAGVLEGTAQRQLFREAEKDARRIKSGEKRAETLVIIALIESSAGMADPAHRLIKSIPDLEELAAALCYQSAYLPLPMVREGVAAALSSSSKLARGPLLTPLLQRLAQLGQVDESVRAAAHIEDEGWRAITLSSVVAHARDGEWAGQIGEVVSLAYSIKDPAARSRALAFVAALLSDRTHEQAREAALEAARAIEGSRARDAALADVISALSISVNPESLIEITLQEIGLLTTKWETLSLLAARMARSGAIEQAIHTAQLIENYRARLKLLADLAPAFSEPIVRQLLASGSTIDDQEDQLAALAVLAPSLPEPIVRSAVELARSPVNASSDAALGVLAGRLAELGRTTDAVDLAKSVQDHRGRAEALLRVTKPLAEPARSDVITEARHAVGQIDDSQARARMLLQLVPLLSSTEDAEQVVREALDVARSIGSPGHRSETMYLLVPTLASLGHYDQARLAITAIEDPWVRLKQIALAQAIQYYPAPQREGLIAEVLAYASGKNAPWRIDDLVLEELAPQLAELGRMSEAKRMTDMISDAGRRALTYATLARLADAEERVRLRDQARALVSDGESNEFALRALVMVAAQSNGQARLNLFRQCLQIALSVPSGRHQHRGRQASVDLVMNELGNADPMFTYRVWEQSLHAIGEGTRPDALYEIAALASMVKAMGDEQSVERIGRVILDVRRLIP